MQSLAVRRVVSRKMVLNAAVVAAALIALGACTKNPTCTTEKQVAEHLAKFAADVQTASLKKTITMAQLKEITTRIDTAGSHYSATKNHVEYCNDIDAIRADFPL